MADKKISALTAATTPLAGTEVLPIVQGGSTVKVSIANVTAGRAVSTGALSVGTADITLDNAYALKGKLVAGTAVTMIKRTSADEVAIDEDGYGAKIGFGGRFGFAGGGNFTVGIGNVVIGTAGQGIDFSANTHAAGMTSELLGWYEEGVFTPTLAFGGTSTGITYALQVGRYTRIGRTVSVQAYLQLSAAGAAVGAMTMEGLPYASANVTNYVSLGTCALDNAASSQDQPIARLNSNSTSVMIMGGTATDNWFQWTDSSILSASLRVFVSLTYTV